SRPNRLSRRTTLQASVADNPSSCIRNGTSRLKADTRKWPLPQQGSSMLNSARDFGQPSKVPAAGVPSSLQRRYSISTGANPTGDAGPARRPLDPVPGTPPSPERVVQKELHHVVFGKQLCHGREGMPVDLLLAPVDLVLLLGLPELVDPAEAVVSQECRS